MKIPCRHNRTQKSLFKFKKIVAGLVIFVVLLTISNLGTSIAAAYLAKDTTINDNNDLMWIQMNRSVRKLWQKILTMNALIMKLRVDAASVI